MFITGSTSSPMLRLHSLPASLLLVMLGIYVAGLMIAYVAFLQDRQAAIKAVRSGISAESGATINIRSARVTSTDRREALIGAAIWPALLLARFTSPVWVMGWLYRDRRPKGDVRHTPGLAHL